MTVIMQGQGTYEVTLEGQGGSFRRLASGLTAADAKKLARQVAEQEAAETGDTVNQLSETTLVASGELISWVEEQSWGPCLGCEKPVADANGPWNFLHDATDTERSVHLECREAALKQLAAEGLAVESTVECSEGHDVCWRGGRAVWNGQSWEINWACGHEQIDWLLARAMERIWGRAWAAAPVAAAA